MAPAAWERTMREPSSTTIGKNDSSIAENGNSFVNNMSSECYCLRIHVISSQPLANITMTSSQSSKTEDRNLTILSGKQETMNESVAKQLPTDESGSVSN